MPSPFLTAEWRFVVILNYSVDPSLLKEFIPAGTTLDEFDGKTWVSMVGFRFERARMRGIWIPFHSDFDEVNLRFYVVRRVNGEVRRGVVFLREIVPRFAVAQVARTCFHEKYVALPMKHQVIEPTSEGGRLQAEYSWRRAGNWSTLRAEAAGRPAIPPAGSAESFFIEHYWGYTAAPAGRTLEYRVEHDKWRTWTATQASLEGDLSALYGSGLAKCLAGPPASALIAEGSTVAVHPCAAI